jgi:hypothetical protein
MPGGAGKAKRSCPMCKSYKFAGNGKDRRPISELRRLGGSTRRISKKVASDE